MREIGEGEKRGKGNLVTRNAASTCAVLPLAVSLLLMHSCLDIAVTSNVELDTVRKQDTRPKVVLDCI